MKRSCALVLLALALGSGCAVQPTAPELKPSVDTTGGEVETRVRARLRTELAAGYYERGNFSVALEEVNLALRADPSYSPAYNVAAVIYVALKEDRLAEQNFTQALSLNAQDSDAAHNYGSFLCQRKREQEGIRQFQAAVRNPLYTMPERSYASAGLCSRAIGDLAAAEEYQRQALKVRPNFPPALYQLADMAYARGDYKTARSHLGVLTRLIVPNAELLWLGVRVERKLGDRVSEESYAAQLRDKFPESEQTRALLSGRYE